MELDFLSAVVPTTGKYCVFTMKGKLRKNIFVDTLENMSATCTAISDSGQNSFYALAGFNESGDRLASSALSVRSLFMDLDCGFEEKEGVQVQKAFPSKQAAREGLHKFLGATGIDKLGSPWLVDSGGGVHVYFPLDADTPIDVWKPVAEALKRAAVAMGFPLDKTVTADASRVLRMPGTLNYKYAPPKPVLLRQRGGVFSLGAVGALLAQYAPSMPVAARSAALMLPGTRPGTGEMSLAAKAMIGNTITLFRNIATRTSAGSGCGQLKHYVQHAAEDGTEPMWRAWLTIAQKCDDGDKAARKLSSLHPYDEGRMLQKLAQIKGPYPCAKFDSENPGICGDCKHWGKITNPLALGREVEMSTEEVVVELAPEMDALPPIKVARPTAPRGFSYGKTGGVYYHKKAEKMDEEDVDIMLMNYDFFMTRMFRDADSYTAEFVVVKGSETTTFGVPTSVVGSMKDITKVLSTNNVFAVSGAGCDAFLANYVRACMTDASSTGRHVPVPARFGWQPDMSFAIGDTIMSARGRANDYTFKSNRLHNLMEAAQPAGTLEQWQKIPHMLRDKALTNDPVMRGHLACSFTGFASTLMYLGPKSAQAVTLYICGTESGAGKSLSSMVANSIWGAPKGLVVGSKTSQTTMMQRAGMLGSLHLNVDEVTEVNRKAAGEWLPTFLYDYSNGAHKIKGSATGNAEIQQDLFWTAIAMLSGNDPAMEAMMGARKYTSMGEVRRCLEWALPAQYTAQWTDAERAVLPLMDTNYGVVGRRWMEWQMSHMDVVSDMYKKVEARWRSISGATDNERFWTAGVVAEITSAVLCGPKYANLVEVPISMIEAFWLEDVVNPMRRIIAASGTSAEDVLNAYTREYIGNFVRIDGSVMHAFSHLVSTHNQTKNAVRGRIEFDVTPGNVDYYIEIKLLKVHCASMGQSYTAFVRELTTTKTMYVSECRKDLLMGTKGPSMRVNCLKITRPVSDVVTGLASVA